MVRLDPSQKNDYDRYLLRHRTLELIDCAIFCNFKNKFEYLDNEVDLFTNPTCPVKSRDFATDLVYLTADKRHVLLVEETRDISSKLEQLKKYADVSSQILRTITKGDVIPNVDVMVVFPQSQREEGLKIYQELKATNPKLGEDRGISLWCYDDNMKRLRCIGGTFSSSFPKDSIELPSRGVGAFKILKKAHPLFIMQFIVLKALESEYGNTEGNIDFDKTKLLKWLGPYGIVNENKWKEALRYGQTAGWLSNYSPEQLTGTINYTKISAKSIGRSKDLVSNFFSAIEEEGDKKQKLISEFGSDTDVESESEKKDVDDGE